MLHTLYAYRFCYSTNVNIHQYKIGTSTKWYKYKYKNIPGNLVGMGTSTKAKVMLVDSTSTEQNVFLQTP